MDRITKSMLNEFAAEHGLSRLDESKSFENFSVYSIVSGEYEDLPSTEDLVVGSGGDTGIDAIAIVVNGTVIGDVDQVDDLVKQNGYCEARFIFVQSETSSNFDMQKIGQFGFGVGDFFEGDPKLKGNEELENFRKIMDRIYTYAAKFKKGNPICDLFYVTTGTWKQDPNLVARIDSVIEDLKDRRIFSSVTFNPYGADKLQKLYTATKNALSREFNFPSRVAVGDIEGVDQAYIGIIPADEFIKLIENENGDMIKSIFYENVRDFQDFNIVNTEIRDTLSSKFKNRFPIMNNGITIIAKKMKNTGNRVYIEDYQIVNGCQSSHVLHNQKALLDDKVQIPLRIISTDNEEVISSIVKATNRQTEVKAEQLIGLTDYQKKLEKFFTTFEDPNKLYYERRSKQYVNSSGVEKTRIVTLGNLVRAFGAVFLMEPHRATRYYQSLLDQVGKKIFVDDHRLEMYYVSALMLYKLDYYFRNGTIDSRLKISRYHMLLAFKVLVLGDDVPRMNSNDMKKKCETLIRAVQDAVRSEKYFKCAAHIIESLAGLHPARDEMKTQAFTDLVINSSKNWKCE